MDFKRRLFASVLLGAFCGLQSCGVIRAGLQILDSPENQERLQALLDDSTSRQDKLRAGLSLANATLKAEKEARERQAAEESHTNTLIGGGAGTLAAYTLIRNRLSDNRKSKFENEVRSGAAPAA